MTPNDLSTRLLSGERIVWSGRPGRGLLFTPRDTFLIPFSLMWCGFTIFWEYSASQSRAASGFFLLWGAMFMCIGLYFVFGRFLVDAWVRQGIRYAVTDRRILIVRPAPFGSFVAVSLTRIQDVDLDERADGRGTIRFGPAASIRNGRQSMGLWSPSLDSTPQFLLIDNGRHVFDLVQRSATNN